MLHSGAAIVLTILLMVLPLPAVAADEAANPWFQKLLSKPGLVIEDVSILAEETILDVYRDNGFRPMWNRANVEDLMRLIDESPNHGLNPVDYGQQQLMNVLMVWLQDPSDEARARVEILLTESLLRYGYHRRLGKIKASSIDPDINFRREAFNNQAPATTLSQALAAPSLSAFIEKLAPSGPFYRALQDWLKVYVALEESGGWGSVQSGATLRSGDSDPRIPSIRARLALTGDLATGANRTSTTFDRDLDNAVKSFQSRHTLDADGIIGAQTLAALNVPVQRRVEQLRASLERLRWIRQEAVETVVAVNIAGFRANFFKDGELVWNTRAMVGKDYRQTPVFRGDIAYMEFNPTWTIPPGILRNDTLPAIKRDPNYLTSKNIRVIDSSGRTVDPATVNWNQYRTSVPYTLRQDPGPNNALGTVKFIFPNKHLVFLHDTPARQLFDRPERAFSSGCIRVEDPLRLAELLLDDPAHYSRSALQGIVDSRKTQRIRLKPNIPVVITYLTAGLTADGRVAFFKDIYSRDEAVLAALNGPVRIDAPEHGGN